MLASVLINNYNYGKFLGYCIDSVLDQAHENVEVIVYDDGSYDNSANVLQRYSDRIKVIKEDHYGRDPNINQANAINEAFNKASGDFVFLLDSDDAFLPRKIERVVRQFDSDSDVVLVQHIFEEIDENGSRTGKLRPYLKKIQDPFSYIYKTHNLLGVFAQTSALAFRRSYLEQILPLHEDKYDGIWPDVRLTRQSIFYGKTCTIREVLGQYRAHNNNDSKRLEDRRHMDEVLSQMYAYFNERAAEQGFGKIDIRRSVNRVDVTGVHKLMRFLFSSEPFSHKCAYIKGLIATSIGKRVKGTT